MSYDRDDRLMTDTTDFQELTGVIRALEDRRYAAMIAGDAAALEDLLADDLRYTHSNAVVDTKASLMGLLATGKLTYRAARPVIDDVFIYGAAALVVGSVELDVTAGGADRTVRVRYTNLGVNTEGRWRFAAWQSTPQPA